MKRKQKRYGKFMCWGGCPSCYYSQVGNPTTRNQIDEASLWMVSKAKLHDYQNKLDHITVDHVCLFNVIIRMPTSINVPFLLRFLTVNHESFLYSPYDTESVPIRVRSKERSHLLFHLGVRGSHECFSEIRTAGHP